MLELNEAFCRMLRYSREELLGRRMGDLVAGEAHQSRTQRLRALSGGGSQRYEARYLRITSYNVCYTKLLRALSQRVDVVSTDQLTDVFDADSSARVFFVPVAPGWRT